MRGNGHVRRIGPRRADQGLSLVELLIAAAVLSLGAPGPDPPCVAVSAHPQSPYQHCVVLLPLLLLVAVRAPVWVIWIVAQVVSPAAGLPPTGVACKV